MREREKFNTRLGFILVSAGCAIGLGNVWKFPYMAGKYGGAAFLFIYLFFLIILGLPILVCEFAVGRGSRKSTARAFHTLEPEGSNFHKFSYLTILANYVLMFFYVMIAGWMMYYCYSSLVGKIPTSSTQEVNGFFNNLLGSPITMIFWTVVVILISFGVCALGVKNGLEKVTKYMMLALILLIVILAINSLLLPNASKGLKFYLVPDFSQMQKIGLGTIIFGAMSQAFFTLSIGAGSMAIFGSYLDKERSLMGESIHVTLLDTFVAVVAGFIIIPACFAFGVEPGSGPGLIFLTLPRVFDKMIGGRIWGTLFFLFMSFAALSTVIAVFENIISYGIDLWGWSRKKSVLINIIIMIIFSLPAILGSNVLSFIQPLGEGSSILDLEDFIVANNILPLGSMVFVLFCASRYGWGYDNFIEEVNTGAGRKFPKGIKYYMLYVIPAVIIFIYLKGYYDMFENRGPVILTIWMIIALLLLALVFSFVYRGRKKKVSL